MLVVVMTAAALTLFMMVVMVMFMLFLQLCQLSSQSCLTVHCTQQLLTGQLIPGSGNDGSIPVVLPQHGNSGIQLCLRNGTGTGEDDGRSGFHLIVVELTEVLHVDLDLACVYDSHGIAQGNGFRSHLIDSADDIRQLANAGGFNDDPLRVILLDDLGQSLTEVTNQGAADTAGVHLGDVDARILQETAVDTDFTEFIFDQHQALFLVSLLNHFLDQSGFTGTQEAGVNINFCHSNTFCSIFLYLVLYHPVSTVTSKNLFSCVIFFQTAKTEASGSGCIQFVHFNFFRHFSLFFAFQSGYTDCRQ